MHYIYGNMGSWKADRPKNLAETSLWQARVARKKKDCKSWEQKIYGESSFESITDSQLLLPIWQCSSWIVIPNSIFHPHGLSDLFMSWMSLQNKESGNEFLKQNMYNKSFFGNALLFCEHGQLKGWPPHFEPIVAKSSISTSVHCFVAFVAWKHGADFCKMHVQQIFFRQCITFLWTWTAERLAAPKT